MNKKRIEFLLTQDEYIELDKLRKKLTFIMGGGSNIANDNLMTIADVVKYCINEQVEYYSEVEI